VADKVLCWLQINTYLDSFWLVYSGLLLYLVPCLSFLFSWRNQVNIRSVIAAFAVTATILSSSMSSAEEVSPAPVAAKEGPPASASASASDKEGATVKSTDEATIALARENALLQEKLKALEECSITSGELAAKNCKRLKLVAADIRAQRQGMADFEGYVKWMSGNVAGYSKYLSAGSVAAGFAKVLPIPYAGQASVFTKFVSKAAISLGETSVSIKKYLATSQQFLTRADALNPDQGVNPQEVSELVRFADQELLKGMIELQERLVTTSELTTSSLSFLESLNHYVGSTDEYWLKTKSLLRSGDDKNEKSFLSESTTSLKDKAQAFHGKFKLFDETVKKDAPVIKSLVAYDDLIREIGPKVAKVK